MTTSRLVHEAVATVLGSAVNGQGLLDDVQNAVMLPAPLTARCA
jgi:hypothetical protein